MDSEAGNAVGIGTVPEGTFLSGASSITTGTGDPEVTGGNEAGTASDAYSPNGAIENTWP